MGPTCPSTGKTLPTANVIETPVRSSATRLIAQISSVVVPESNLHQYLDSVRRSEIPTFRGGSGSGIGSVVTAALCRLHRGDDHLDVAVRRGAQTIHLESAEGRKPRLWQYSA